MMKRQRWLLLAAACVAGLGGCADFAPYPTAATAAATGDAGPRVSICYNTLVSTLAEIRHTAQGECNAGTVATPVDTDWYLQHCPLLLPARASFVCAPTKK